MITVAICSGLAVWDDFHGPLICLNDENKCTVALGLRLFTGLYNAQWHLLMAGSVMDVTPVIVVFFVAQRYFVASIARTGIKG